MLSAGLVDRLGHATDLGDGHAVLVGVIEILGFDLCVPSPGDQNRLGAHEEDCRDDKGIIIFRQDAVDLGQNFLFKILGRVTLEDIKIKNSQKKL